MVDEYGYDEEDNYTQLDNKFFDGTDFAHPAWFRGCDRGAKVVIEKLEKIILAHNNDSDVGHFLEIEIVKIRQRIK